MTAGLTERRTQEERSQATRQALLDATIASLIERGYSGTSTTEIARRAGVSRGAQLHHFGSKNTLVAAAIEHLNTRRVEQVHASAAAIPNGPERPRAALASMAATFEGPLYAAAVELWIAARTDDELRQALLPVESRLMADLTDVCNRYITDDPVLSLVIVEFLLGRGVAAVGIGSPITTDLQDTTLARFGDLLLTALDNQQPPVT